MENILIDNMIDDIINGETVSAKDRFDDLISSKVNDVLDTRKKEIAASLFDKHTLTQSEE